MRSHFNGLLALLLRAGLRVAKPYWGDDEIDFLVFVDKDARIFPIPVQVKSVQSTPDDVEKYVQNLKKKYLESNKYLCLAIYSVDRDKIWLIPTSETIRQAYHDWAIQNPAQRTQYVAIPNDGDVRVRVNVSPGGDPAFDNLYLLPRDNQDVIIQRFNNVSNEMQNDPDFKEKSVFKFVGGLDGGIHLGGSSPAQMNVADDGNAGTDDTDNSDQ